jgi:cytochrome P450
MEGEHHHRLRPLVSRTFTARAVEALRPCARSVSRGLRDRVFSDGRCDAVPAFCNPFPIPVICALVGIEPDRIDDRRRWAGSILRQLRFDTGSFLEEIERALASARSRGGSAMAGGTAHETVLPFTQADIVHVGSLHGVPGADGLGSSSR